MLIPLGILAASSASAGTYELIETYTVGSGGIASVTFNVSSYSSTYQHLQIRFAARSNRADTADSLIMQINSDTASNYREHVLYGDGSNVYSAAGSQTTFMTAATMAGNNATANSFGAGVIDLLDAYESKNKTIRSLSGVVTNWVQLRSGLHMSTTAVSTIKLQPANGTLLQQYSRFSIYGLKAS